MCAGCARGAGVSASVSAAPFPVTSECIVVRGAERSIPRAVTAAAAQREPRTSQPGPRRPRPRPRPRLVPPPPPGPARRRRAPPTPTRRAPSLPPPPAPPPAARVRVTGSLGHCLGARTPNTRGIPPTSSSAPSMRCKHERQEEEEGPHLGRGCPPGTSRPAPRPAPPRPSPGAAARSPAPRLRLFVIPREWACRGPRVRARAEGRRIISGTPRPAHPGPPGTLLPGTWRWESRGASREPVNLRAHGAGHFPLYRSRGDLCVAITTPSPALHPLEFHQ